MELSIVTGAFSYTGKYITKRLFAHGASLTGRNSNRAFKPAPYLLLR